MRGEPSHPDTQDRMKRHSIEVRPDRLAVTYDHWVEEYPRVYDHAAALRLQGWRMLSVDTAVIGFTGTAANMFLNTGGGSATEIRTTILYERIEEPAAT